MRNAAIPSFFLYGEAPQSVGDRFLHLEDLDDRSRANDWNIRPHAHTNLSHIFFIASGSGEMTADARTIAFQAPCLLLVPASVVHGFTYEAGAGGTVLTISEAYLQAIVRREAEFRTLFASAAGVPLGEPQRVRDGLERLARELAWTAPGHAAAVEALLVTLFVEILRLRQAGEREIPPAHGAQAALVARFRELVEARYRSDTRVEAYAEALAAHPKRLRAACLSVAGATPLGIVQERLLLEAKRLLLYSNMTVAEAGYYLGFSDPAYFSRFFAKAAGVPPRAFRDAGGPASQKTRVPQNAN